MSHDERTPRQRLVELLTNARLTARQLAERLGMPERQVEDHLQHVVRTLARDPTRRFLLEPSSCQECGFVFRGRKKLTCPSRCPKCRSESITMPRYGITSTVRPHSGASCAAIPALIPTNPPATDTKS